MALHSKAANKKVVWKKERAQHRGDAADYIRIHCNCFESNLTPAAVILAFHPQQLTFFFILVFTRVLKVSRLINQADQEEMWVHKVSNNLHQRTERLRGVSLSLRATQRQCVDRCFQGCV